MVESTETDHFLDDFYSLQFHYRFSSVRGEMIAFQIIQLVEEEIFANVIEKMLIHVTQLFSLPLCSEVTFL